MSKDTLGIMKAIKEKYIEKNKLKSNLISIIKSVEGHKGMCSDHKKVAHMEGFINGIKTVLDELDHYN